MLIQKVFLRVIKKKRRKKKKERPGGGNTASSMLVHIDQKEKREQERNKLR